MKKSVLTIVILVAGLFVASQFITSCGDKKQAEENHEHMEGDSMNHHEDMKMDSTTMDATQLAYACPMHPEVTGKEGDKCSKCGMKLEPVKKN